MSYYRFCVAKKVEVVEKTKKNEVVEKVEETKDQIIESTHICAICQELAFEPIMLNCQEHLICNTCGKHMIAHKVSSCPTCRVALTNETYNKIRTKDYSRLLQNIFWKQYPTEMKTRDETTDIWKLETRIRDDVDFYRGLFCAELDGYLFLDYKQLAQRINIELEKEIFTEEFARDFARLVFLELGEYDSKVLVMQNYIVRTHVKSNTFPKYFRATANTLFDRFEQLYPEYTSNEVVYDMMIMCIYKVLRKGHNTKKSEIAFFDEFQKECCSFDSDKRIPSLSYMKRHYARIEDLANFCDECYDE